MNYEAQFFKIYGHKLANIQNRYLTLFDKVANKPVNVRRSNVICRQIIVIPTDAIINIMLGVTSCKMATMRLRLGLFMKISCS